MKHTKKKTVSHTRKMIAAAMMAALSYALSTVIVLPNMAPFQHMMDVLAAVILGPWYATLSAILTGTARMAFQARPATSLVSILVAPFLAALLYRWSGKFSMAFVGEVFGVGVLGALLSYPVMKYIYGLDLHQFYFYIPYFVPSATIGAGLGVAVLYSLHKTGLLKRLKRQLGE